jgi:hypothetical protein
MRSNCVTVAALCVALAGAGCHKRKTASLPPVAAPPVGPRPLPPPPVTPPPEPLPRIPPPPSAKPPLEDASRAFAAGNYDDAARGYENYLRVTPSGGSRDDALFHLGIIYALRRPPAAEPNNWKAASALFRQLLDEYPHSPFRAPANLILSLRAELDNGAADARQREQKIKQLTTELDRLKKIDAERRRRP